MHIAHFLIAVLMGLLASSVAAAQSPSARLPEPVSQALAQAGIPESAAAFYVHEIGAERPLVAHGAERAMNPDRKSTRLNSSHIQKSRMPSSA